MHIDIVCPTWVALMMVFTFFLSLVVWEERTLEVLLFFFF
ncbi:hypothetical protein AMTRI_Chr07g78150 [Amborella trichopoda]